MQIMDNVYVDIYVKGSKLIKELSYGNLEHLMLVETSGAALPYICFSIFTHSGEWAKEFVKNNTIVIKMGNTENDAETFEIDLIDNNTSAKEDRSRSGWVVTGAGFIGGTEFMVNKSKSRAYMGNSYSVAKDVISEYPKLNPKISTNIKKVKEEYVIWRQTLEPSYIFLVKTLLHMDIGPSSPIFSFDKYGTFHLNSYKDLKKEGPVWIFEPVDSSTRGSKDAEDARKTLKYLNNFNVENHQTAYNMYSGYDRISEIIDLSKGTPTYEIDENNPIIASSEKADKKGAGNRIRINKVQSKNVHKSYMKSFSRNTNKLVSLSSIQGCLVLRGYHPELKPTDYVRVKTSDGKKWTSTLGGYYFIDTIQYIPNFLEGAFYTYVYVTKDNLNNVENGIIKKDKKVNITKKAIQKLSDAIGQARVATAMASQVMDGTFLGGLNAFLSSTKYNLLRMFSVGGVTLDFNSQASLIQSLMCAGNSIMNILLGAILPKELAFVLRDFLIDDDPFSGLRLLNKYVAEYVPFEIQGIVSSIIDAIFGVGDSLNSIAKDNGIVVRKTPEVTDVSTQPDFEEESNLVGSILEEIEDNTAGVDLPLPMISLTEEQKLIPEEDLKEYIVDETIANLTDLGYLENLTDSELDNFKNVLLGNSEESLAETEEGINIINKINVNAGSSFSYRFWGTYGASNEALYAWSYGDETVYTKTLDISKFTRLYNNDYSPYMEDFFKVEQKAENIYGIFYEGVEKVEAERDEEKDIYSNALSQLTDFYINKGYKDKYRTLPCTKLISATGNKRLYFACPQREQNIKFYINSRRVFLESFPIDLGYKDSRGNPLLYNVYFTNIGYNSNSTMLEVRQG